MLKKKEKASYLEEHLFYELLMLRYSYQKINTEIDQLDWNAFIESFAVHARSLIDFLTNKGNQNTVKAQDFTSNYKHKPKKNITGVYQDIDRQITHLGKLRTDAAKKISRDRAAILYSG